MDVLQAISTSMGAAWASGINLYATVFVLGFLNATGNITLPEQLQVLSEPMVMVVAGFMYVVEFFADKVPGLDTAWDTIHTFIRIPAGAVLAAGALGDLSPAAEIAGALAGGSVAAATHATKSGTRVLINTSPEPVTNWIASLGEDATAIAGIFLALHYPWLFLSLLIVFLLLLAWFLPKLWRGIKKVFGAIGRLLGFGKPKEPDPLDAPVMLAAEPQPNSPATTAEPDSFADTLGQVEASISDTPGRSSSEPQPDPPVTPAGQDSVAAKLDQLESLLKAEKITPEEFQELRAKVLEKMV